MLELAEQIGFSRLIDGHVGAANVLPPPIGEPHKRITAAIAVIDEAA
ncbi:hypothetical protein H7H78_17470 [Mycobacterium shinjukuense]|uniref:Uncharacterized protein n=1 Tax=Mycobacterium shinjukuense TaxID=398694 RepID=A0A7I7MPS3_9MYCO|nr:hypothetical protein [Mycobacterium shinjukuense]MCV6987135.1 hypothetical protein [Mycobacterium shinjukuense]BBX74086.1 hypothetical protein MSHI_19920 [Mycobacterium shinjukuense]